ncbi:hypothetical protein LOTGIDRAFT_111288 [Lottia gigantea]|uniref:guanylate cyclase n=1 Tax=Lottia gigantea TaxID=225164 RepID=V4AX84_LOTGI|nr:hypothetical protein LOTGIDRAFT_111288 [Lottia gigantea]ESP02183.1 hypothetical protein LOTGIDRAFT_111288 [Lottia gigantea]
MGSTSTGRSSDGQKDSCISEDSPRSRKISNISTCSSIGSEETSDSGTGERKIDVPGLIEAVGTLILPSIYIVYMQLPIYVSEKELLVDIKNVKFSLFPTDTFTLSFNDSGLRHRTMGEEELISLVSACADIQQTDIDTFLRTLGREYFKLVEEEYGKCLRMLGSNMIELFSNLDGLQTLLKSSPKFEGVHTPSFRCEFDKNKIQIHYYSPHRKPLEFVAGILESVAKVLFSLEFEMQVSGSLTETSQHHIFYITTYVNNNNNHCSTCSISDTLSSDPSKSKIGVSTFCNSFPFHLIFDKDLNIIQLGSALLKMIGPHVPTHGRHIQDYFIIIRPHVKISFSAILSRVNSNFVLRTKTAALSSTNSVQDMELKGQMFYLQENNTILYIGSPSVEKLDELIGKGIYISDIPIHDATRDVILVGEQTKAQDGLKKRMEQLKLSIEEATKAVEIEKQKNVELLKNIFPSDIAQRLWRDETVEPRKIDDVTVLFSDIVGFTAICSSCTPMQVVNMLNSLYTHFDNSCGIIDVYKIETIGDAYCVAGGIHKSSNYHAHQICWMALKMMEAAKDEKSHDGNMIKMRIGIHSGPVLAGIVGKRMPRYCLFGNSVTLANKFESGSEPLKIHISPTTYE